MIDLLQGLPPNVVGLRGSGRITAEDYEKVLVPAVEEKLHTHRRIRLLYVLGDEVEGYTAGAAWEDTKVGLKHLTSWERMAVVTDIDWIENAIKAVGFALPCEVRVFDDDELNEARGWISEPSPISELSFEILRDQSVLVIRPQGELEAGDFERVAADVDPFIEETGDLRGLIIVAAKFPGWEDFSALTSHLRFVRDHHQKIRRVAIVSDEKLVSMAPRLLRHFIGAEVERYPTAREEEALQWVTAP